MCIHATPSPNKSFVDLSFGEISFEFDGAYYIVMGFVNQNLFKENKLILLSLIVMLLMTAISILIKYKFIFC